MSAHHESVPVFKKTGGIAILLLIAEIVVSYGAAPVLSSGMGFGVKASVALGIVALWSVFSVYAVKALEAGYMSVMELAANTPVPVADVKLAKAA